METIEQKINIIIMGSFKNIEDWKIIPENRICWEMQYNDNVYDVIDSMIQNADLAECLTSPSEYIREYRKWFEQKEKRKKDDKN